MAQQVKKIHLQGRSYRRCGFDPWVGRIPWRRKWLPTPVLLPGKCHGERSLVGCSWWGCQESDMKHEVAGIGLGGKEETASLRRKGSRENS